jgi:predicted O-methyltransferase YrrM
MPRAPEPLKTALMLVSLLPRRPIEFYDWATGYADLALDRLSGKPATHETVTWDAALRSLEASPGESDEILGEPALLDMEGHTRGLLKNIRGEDAFSQRWAADSLFARLCYLACRRARPSTVVETGVAYGVSSAYILKALEENGHGILHSIDLPPLRKDYECFWGVAAPEDLRERWRLHRGSSSRILPGILEELGAIDLFVHDSLHTSRNMRREFETVWPRLRTGGIIIADDVERNPAFADLRRKNPSLWRVVRDRERTPLHGKAAPVVFGIAVK